MEIKLGDTAKNNLVNLDEPWPANIPSVVTLVGRISNSTKNEKVIIFLKGHNGVHYYPKHLVRCRALLTEKYEIEI